MKTTYHRAEEDCRKWSQTRWHKDWDTLLQSAAMTADAWGRAYIMVTKGVPERRAGGMVFVTRDMHRHGFADPAVLLCTVEG